MTIPGHTSKTDWERVKREYESDAPIPYDAEDVADGLYDPNDDAAVDRFFTEANRVYPATQTRKPPISKAS